MRSVAVLFCARFGQKPLLGTVIDPGGQLPLSSRRCCPLRLKTPCQTTTTANGFCECGNRTGGTSRSAGQSGFFPTDASQINDHEMHVRAALSKHRRLEDVLAELERTVNYAGGQGTSVRRAPTASKFCECGSRIGVNSQSSSKQNFPTCLPRIRRYQSWSVTRSKYRSLRRCSRS